MTVFIGYTTLYREGGPKFERAAQTLAREKRDAGEEVVCVRLESKREFVDAMRALADAGRRMRELHFIGHSGLYGPMFRTTAMPEQFSPHEWRTLPLPFAEGARAYFHACRSARWFAPFFADVYGVTAFGYHHYTTVSTRRDRFAWEGPFARDDAPLYIVACAGRKSHGLLGSAGKYLGLTPMEPMKGFDPRGPHDTSYDPVATAYSAVFEDIGVRRRELRFIRERVRRMDRPRVLDVGCGNGALLRRLAPEIRRGAGVDRSAKMIELAVQRSAGAPHLDFHPVSGPSLPFADASFDLVVSLLSFRYLDWDPMMNEMRRVLAPGGRLVVVDMVAKPLEARDVPGYVRCKVRDTLERARRPGFALRLAKLVRTREWQTMLRHNPMRAAHEYEWYFGSRYPHGTIEKLGIGYAARVLAFDSGPLEPGWVAPQSYP